MSAYMTYEIIGDAWRKQVSKKVRAHSMPDQKTAEWILKELYPAVTNVRVEIPAAKGYPSEDTEMISAGSMIETPIGRTR